jgi:hypothetical protein
MGPCRVCGGRRPRSLQKFIDEVAAECEISEVARKAAASKIVRAIGIEVLHKQAFTYWQNGGT